MLNTVLPSPWRAAFQRWWGTLPAHRQDRVASLLPLLAVAMFAMAVVSAIGYLRMEEWHTENQTLQRDGEYSRQRISVRLAERLELLQKFGHELTLPAGA
ncbi:MAG: PAS domain-containing sensor histidine kinase, partial [Brachymonas sp.]